MSKIIDFSDIKRFGIDPDFDGSEECDQLLEDCKEIYDHVVIMGFTKDGSYHVAHTEMPVMYLAYFEKLFSRSNDPETEQWEDE